MPLAWAMVHVCAAWRDTACSQPAPSSRSALLCTDVQTVHFCFLGRALRARVPFALSRSHRLIVIDSVLNAPCTAENIYGYCGPLRYLDASFVLSSLPSPSSRQRRVRCHGEGRRSSRWQTTEAGACVAAAVSHASAVADEPSPAAALCAPRMQMTTVW